MLLLLKNMTLCDIGYEFPTAYADSLDILKITSDGMDTSAMLLHEKLVAHTFAVSDELEGRSGVWGEHSYARERGPPPHAHVRALLQPRAARDPGAGGDQLDVETLPRPPPAPPLDECALSDDGDDDDDDDDDEPDDWERAVRDAAPAPAHARLAAATLDALHDLRLRRLAGGRGRWARAEAAGEAAERVRAALAAHWPLAPWLHSTLLTFLPRRERALYDELTTELRRAVPRLAERLAPRPPPPAPDPLDAVGEPVDSEAEGPWLAWVSSGCERQDARWRRRMGALLHVRELAPSAPAPPALPAPPDRWCTERAHAARAALADLLQEAGGRAVAVGGWGAGAALAAWVAGAGGRRARALLLLAPPLLSAEGGGLPGDAGEAGAPALCVVGTGAARGGRGAAGEECAGGARRLLQVAGADDALRLPRRLRLRTGVPQQALDAAVAEECARWLTQVCAAPAAPTVPSGPRAVPAALRAEGGAVSSGKRVIEIVDGCVVTRGAGPGPGPGAAARRELQAADIMRLPIVFADDAAVACRPAGGAEEEAAAAPVTVRAGAGAAPGSGGVQYTRVIVAKRAAQQPLVLRPQRRPRHDHA